MENIVQYFSPEAKAFLKSAHCYVLLAHCIPRIFHIPQYSNEADVAFMLIHSAVLFLLSITTVLNFIFFLSFQTESIMKYTLIQKQHKGLWQQNSLDWLIK
jgi:hypothetical protein